MTAPLYNLTDTWTADNSDAILMNVTTAAHPGNLIRLQADSTDVFKVDTAGKATIALGTITASAQALTITGTFNSGGTTFAPPLLVNITETAAASRSFLFGLQSGGSDVFKVDDSGGVYLASSRSSGAQVVMYLQDANTFYFFGGTVSIRNTADTNNSMNLLYGLGFGSTTSPDTAISRGAAGVVAIGTGAIGNASGSIKAKTKAGAPAAGDVADGTWALIRDTTNSTTKLYYNNGGALQSVALT
jgi:hypothetical protein